MSPRTPTGIEEYRLAQVESRLKEGAGAFADLRQGIQDTNDRITEETRVSPWKLWGVALVLAAAIMSAGGVLYQVRDTAETVEEHEGTIREVQTTVSEVKGAQDSLRRAVEDGQRALNEKLDKALAAPPTDPLGRRKAR